MMKLSVIGTGYVGLVQGAIFAELGHDVVCVDSLEDKIRSIVDFCSTGRGELPVHEPGLPDIVKTNYDNARLRFSTDLKKAVENSQAMFICVGTPTLPDGNPNMSYVYKVAEQIGDAMNYKDGIVKSVVLKSTVPVNTHKEVSRIIGSRTKNKCYVISNPEFMAQGRAVDDCRFPSRIVIGTSEDYATNLMKAIYFPLTKKRNVEIEFMDNISAELNKYFANTYLAIQIDATNRFAELTSRLGGDWNKIKHSIKLDKRIGRFYHAGLGFGGSCFEKDVLALSCTMEKEGLADSAEWLRDIIHYNQEQRVKMIPKIEDYFQNRIEGKTIAVWGLSFKADTNDVRGAASIPSIFSLVSKGAKIKAYDPAAAENARLELETLFNCNPEEKGITFCAKKEDTLKGSDALFIASEWTEFYSPDFSEIKASLNYPAIFDGKSIYDISSMKSLGFDYFSIGRPDVRI